ncbi:hypothetical protein GUJ93_ZPchr0008g13737 [Zizania palustris]|uniref:Uncharacterized protein n=1 Tax=Zizania palustris TaxID=103762 RepID=A0A8J5UX59_ZIZPA|nr:hypothetical protein GUJ93_ZPchr0008g13737 [Zizania palustris]
MDLTDLCFVVDGNDSSDELDTSEGGDADQLSTGLYLKFSHKKSCVEEFLFKESLQKTKEDCCSSSFGTAANLKKSRGFFLVDNPVFD